MNRPGRVVDMMIKAFRDEQTLWSSRFIAGPKRRWEAVRCHPSGNKELADVHELGADDSEKTFERMRDRAAMRAALNIIVLILREAGDSVATL